MKNKEKAERSRLKEYDNMVRSTENQDTLEDFKNAFKPHQEYFGKNDLNYSYKSPGYHGASAIEDQRAKEYQELAAQKTMPNKSAIYSHEMPKDVEADLQLKKIDEERNRLESYLYELRALEEKAKEEQVYRPPPAKEIQNLSYPDMRSSERNNFHYKEKSSPSPPVQNDNLVDYNHNVKFQEEEPSQGNYMNNLKSEVKDIGSSLVQTEQKRPPTQEQAIQTNKKKPYDPYKNRMNPTFLSYAGNEYLRAGQVYRKAFDIFGNQKDNVNSNKRYGNSIGTLHRGY